MILRFLISEMNNQHFMNTEKQVAKDPSFQFCVLRHFRWGSLDQTSFLLAALPQLFSVVMNALTVLLQDGLSFVDESL